MTIVVRDADQKIYRIYESVDSRLPHVTIRPHNLVVNHVVLNEPGLVRFSQDMVVAVGIFKTLNAGEDPRRVCTHTGEPGHFELAVHE